MGEWTLNECIRTTPNRVHFSKESYYQLTTPKNIKWCCYYQTWTYKHKMNIFSATTWKNVGLFVAIWKNNSCCQLSLCSRSLPGSNVFITVILIKSTSSFVSILSTGIIPHVLVRWSDLELPIFFFALHNLYSLLH